MLKHLSVILALLIMCACSNSVEQGEVGPDRSNARALYKEQKRAILAYIDTLTHSTDSATLVRAATELQPTLTKLAYKYPAETDYLFTSAQQDTILILTHKYLKLVRTKAPAIKEEVPTDTLPTDTLPLQTIPESEPMTAEEGV